VGVLTLVLYSIITILLLHVQFAMVLKPNMCHEESLRGTSDMWTRYCSVFVMSHNNTVNFKFNRSFTLETVSVASSEVN